jgi:hypothetical protein
VAATVKDIERLMAGMESALVTAFLTAVASIKSQAKIAELEAAIVANDLDAAFRAAGLRPGSWTLVTESTRAAYIEGGQFTVMSGIPKRLGFQFNPMNPRALEWISTHSADLVVELNLKQRAAIRTAMTLGNEAGRNPRSIALDIVGRVNRTGRRQGGVIGLHEQFADFAGNARRELQALDSNYFTRVRRDRRYDAMVQRSIDSGKPLTRAEIDRIIGRYEDRLLQTRGESIARTEALAGMNASADEAMQQVVEEGLAQQDAIEGTWSSARDAKVRSDHASANGQKRMQGQPFNVGGYPMRYPGDPSAPASQRIRCRCIVQWEVDFSKTLL